MSRVSIIILNWNSWEHTLRCLATLFQSTYENYNVILIDNGSDDNSFQKILDWVEGRIATETKVLSVDSTCKPIKIYEYNGVDLISIQRPEERLSKSLTMIRSKENLGFAGGCNFGITYALSDKTVQYILLLNNDMEVEKDFIPRLVAEIERDEYVGACQPKILLSQDEGVIDALGIDVTWYGYAKQIGHKKPDQKENAQVKYVFGASGGAVLLRRQMLESIGLFDEDFFAYYEDVDLFLRAKASGWKTMSVPSSVVYHFHSGSLGKDSPRKWYFIVRTSNFFVVKNLSFLSIIFFFLFSYPLLVLTSLYRTGCSRESFKFVLRGVKDGFSGIPRCLQKRYGFIKPLLCQINESTKYRTAINANNCPK